MTTAAMLAGLFAEFILSPPNELGMTRPRARRTLEAPAEGRRILVWAIIQPDREMHKGSACLR